MKIKKYTDKELETMWDELEDVPFDEDEAGCLRLACEWKIWDIGTDVEEIWYWFDEHHSKGVGWLMNEYEG